MDASDKIESIIDFSGKWWLENIDNNEALFWILSLSIPILMFLYTITVVYIEMTVRRVGYIIERRRKYINTSYICLDIPNSIQIFNKVRETLKIDFIRQYDTNLYRIVARGDTWNSLDIKPHFIEKLIYRYSDLAVIAGGAILSGLCIYYMDRNMSLTLFIKMLVYDMKLMVIVILSVVSVVFVNYIIVSNHFVEDRMSSFITENKPKGVDPQRIDEIHIPSSVTNNMDLFSFIPFSITDIEEKYNVIIFMSMYGGYYVKYLQPNSIPTELSYDS